MEPTGIPPVTKTRAENPSEVGEKNTAVLHVACVLRGIDDHVSQHGRVASTHDFPSNSCPSAIHEPRGEADLTDEMSTTFTSSFDRAFIVNSVFVAKVLQLTASGVSFGPMAQLAMLVGASPIRLFIASAATFLTTVLSCRMASATGGASNGACASMTVNE